VKIDVLPNRLKLLVPHATTVAEPVPVVPYPVPAT
jgi:hypothetical protein